MSRKTTTQNGYETTLAAELQPGVTTIVVESTFGIADGTYLAIDATDPTNREWVKVGTKSSTTQFDNCIRGLAGSMVEGSGSLHTINAKVSTVFTKQLQDDIFADIEEVDGRFGDFLPLDGGESMDGTLDMAFNLVSRVADPVVDTDAANSRSVAADVETHRLDEDAHHTKFTAADAVAAVAADDPYVRNTGDTVDGDLAVTGFVTVGTNVVVENTVTVKNDVDIHDRLWIKGLIAAPVTHIAPNMYVHTNGLTYKSDFVPLSTAGTAAKASKWATARKITLTGGVTGSVTLDGSGNVSLAATVKAFTHNHDTIYLKLAGGTMAGTLASRHILPSASSTYDIGSTTKNYRTIHANQWWSSNNDHIDYDDGNNEWKCYTDGALSTIFGKNVTRMSGTIRFYKPLPAASSIGGYATLRRRDDSGDIWEITSHPKYKTNVQPVKGAADQARRLVHASQPVTYQDVEHPEDGFATGLLSTEVAEAWPGAIRWDPEDTTSPKGIHYEMLTLPLMALARDHDDEIASLVARVEVLEAMKG